MDSVSGQVMKRRLITETSANKKSKQIERKKDIFCWWCHQDVMSEKNDVFNCSKCARVYHNSCFEKLKASEAGQGCECNFDCYSKIMKQLKKEDLKAFLQKILQSVLDEKTSKIKGSVEESNIYQKAFQVWPMFEDNYILCDIIDLNVISDKIEHMFYKNVAEFYQDVKHILHNSLIVNSGKKFQATVKLFEKAVKKELFFAEGCLECYLQENTSENFLKICTKPHQIVWAKLKGFPFWPAKCLQIVKNQADVRFFGTHDRSLVPVSQVYKFSKMNPGNNSKKSKPSSSYQAAMQEILNYIELYNDNVGSFQYFPEETPVLGSKVSSKKKNIKKKSPSSRTALEGNVVEHPSTSCNVSENVAGCSGISRKIPVPGNVAGCSGISHKVPVSENIAGCSGISRKVPVPENVAGCSGMSRKVPENVAGCSGMSRKVSAKLTRTFTDFSGGPLHSLTAIGSGRSPDITDAPSLIKTFFKTLNKVARNNNPLKDVPLIDRKAEDNCDISHEGTIVVERSNDNLLASTSIKYLKECRVILVDCKGSLRGKNDLGSSSVPHVSSSLLKTSSDSSQLANNSSACDDDEIQFVEFIPPPPPNPQNTANGESSEHNINNERATQDPRSRESASVQNLEDFTRTILTAINPRLREVFNEAYMNSCNWITQVLLGTATGELFRKQDVRRIINRDYKEKVQQFNTAKILYGKVTEERKQLLKEKKELEEKFTYFSGYTRSEVLRDEVLKTQIEKVKEFEEFTKETSRKVRVENFRIQKLKQWIANKEKKINDLAVDANNLREQCEIISGQIMKLTTDNEQRKEREAHLQFENHNMMMELIKTDMEGIHSFESIPSHTQDLFPDECQDDDHCYLSDTDLEFTDPLDPETNNEYTNFLFE